jgi:hypothetical protein
VKSIQDFIEKNVSPKSSYLSTVFFILFYTIFILAMEKSNFFRLYEEVHDLQNFFIYKNSFDVEAQNGATEGRRCSKLRRRGLK